MKEYKTWFSTSIGKEITGDKGREAGGPQTNGRASEWR